MNRYLSRVSAKIDWILIVVVLLLLCLGLVAIYSVALGSNDASDLLNFKKQLLFMATGLAALFFCALFIDYRALSRYSTGLYLISLALLLAVLVAGRTIRGTTGWFSVGLFAFQPVEFVKIASIIFLAKFFSDKARYIYDVRYLVGSSIGLIVLVGLVLLQPDFGSAMILCILWGGFILISGIRRSHLLMIVGIALASAAILWFFIFADYQRDRIRVFLDPSLDPLGRGYNVTQATIAIGSGRWWGKGVGFGSQSQLKFLPESQTDFILAVIGEELGFAGIFVTLALYGAMLYRVVSIAKRTSDNFAMYLSIGISLVLFAHITINVGMNLGLLPVTGITLPFISYGGSSLFADLILIGLAESVAVRG